MAHILDKIKNMDGLPAHAIFWESNLFDSQTSEVGVFDYNEVIIYPRRPNLIDIFI